MVSNLSNYVSQSKKQYLSITKASIVTIQTYMHCCLNETALIINLVELLFLFY